MSANATPPPVQSFAEIITGLFPWLARFGLDASSKRLQVRSDGTGLDIEVGPATSPVARTTDGVGYLYAEVGSGSVAIIYWSPTQGASPPSSGASWTPIASGSAPTSTTEGTPITITGGSLRVTCG